MRKTGRLHIRVSPELAENIKAYADRHKSTLTELVEMYFRKLLAEEPVARMVRLGFEEDSCNTPKLPSR
jgi:hypothetical protein